MAVAGRAWAYERTCGACGSTYVPNRREQKACSVSCGRQLRADRQGIYNAPCISCGKPVRIPRGSDPMQSRTCRGCISARPRYAVCTADGCDKAPRSAHADLCPQHYHRQYRHGDVNRVAVNAGVSASHGRKYRVQHLPGHPLAPGSGRVYVHRAVLYDKIGPGTHPCHWCGKAVRWTVGKAPDMLTVDHLDGHGDHNDPANLVPACHKCNSARASAMRSDVLRAAGWWSSHDTIAALRARTRRR